MASELTMKLNARRELVENEGDQFESEQETSTSDCPRISPRKVKKDFPAEAGSPVGGFPRVPSPQRDRRRVSREFKEEMSKRKSHVEKNAAEYESTPSKRPSLADIPADLESSNSPIAEEKAATVSRILNTAVEKLQSSDSVDARCDDHSACGIPEDVACKVYVGNLSWKTRFNSLTDHMSKAGTIAFSGVLGEDGTVRGYGWSRGFGFVIYETPEDAKAAVEQMNGTDLDGRTITVDSWSANSKDDKNSAARPAKTNKWSGQKSWAKDWSGSDMYWPMFGMAGQSWGQSRQRWNNQRSQRGDAKVKAWVGNVSHRADWVDLKNHMEPAGDVAWSEIMTQGGWQGGKSKGVGFVEYKTPEQVDEAVNSLNGTEMQGRKIVVDHWTGKKK